MGNDEEALARAIRAAGSARKLAALIGATHPTVVKWARVPAKWILKVETATGIPRHELRPDLYEGYRRIKVRDPR
jgi:DNA-binding transcriptional regulator YdaS (Cro superfamily)